MKTLLSCCATLLLFSSSIAIAQGQCSIGVRVQGTAETPAQFNVKALESDGSHSVEVAPGNATKILVACDARYLIGATPFVGAKAKQLKDEYVGEYNYKGNPVSLISPDGSRDVTFPTDFQKAK